MKIPLLKKIAGKNHGVPATPPGWQPARQAVDQLDIPVSALLQDDAGVLETGIKIARRLCDRVRTLPGARTGKWGKPGGCTERLISVCITLSESPDVMALPPLWRLAAFLVVAARAVRVIHGIQVEYQDGHLWDPLAGAPSRPWRWRLAESRYPDSDWQEAFWLIISLLPENGLRQLKTREEVYTQLVSALTLQDGGQNLLSQIAECAELQVQNEQVSWPDMSVISNALKGSEFCAITQSVEQLCSLQKARLDRLDRESGMVENIRYQWNTQPLIKFLTLAQALPATPDGVYSEPGGLGTLICDALQVAVRIRKSCALPPDEPEEQMRQGEAWNTAVWFMVLSLGLQRLYHMRVFYFRDLSWHIWHPETGPLPCQVPYRSHFEHTPDAAARALPAFLSLMPAGMMSWFRPFPLLYRAFTGALTGHSSGLLIRKMAEGAIQKASEQWLRDHGLPVTTDAGTLSLPEITPPASYTRPEPKKKPEHYTEPVTTASSTASDFDESAVTASGIVTSNPLSSEPNSALDDMLTMLTSPPATENTEASVQHDGHSPTRPSEDEEKTSDADNSEALINWLRNGISDGSLAVNTPDALIHIWSPGFVFIECPAIIQRWAASRTGSSDDRDQLWRSALRILRNSHFFHDTDGKFPEGRITSEDGRFRNVKGHLVRPGKLFQVSSIPQPSNCFTLRKKK